MANKKFYVDIDLQNNKIDNATIGTNSAISTTAGSFQYNSSTGRLQYRDGVGSLTQDVANLNDLTSLVGALVFKGGIDCSGASPNPNITTDSSVKKGDFYVVTVAGTFLTKVVEVGDSIIANQNNPGATVGNYTILQGNVVIATESVAGLTYLASSAQVSTGTENGAYAVNPLKLQEKVDSLSKVFTITSWSGTSGNYTYSAAHNLNASGVAVSFVDSSGNAAEFAYTVVDNNTVTVKSNTNPSGIIVSFVRAKA